MFDLNKDISIYNMIFHYVPLRVFHVNITSFLNKTIIDFYT